MGLSWSARARACSRKSKLRSTSPFGNLLAVRASFLPRKPILCHSLPKPPKRNGRGDQAFRGEDGREELIAAHPCRNHAECCQDHEGEQFAKLGRHSDPSNRFVTASGRG